MEASSQGLISAGKIKLAEFVPFTGETTDTEGMASWLVSAAVEWLRCQRGRKPSRSPATIATAITAPTIKARLDGRFVAGLLRSASSERTDRWFSLSSLGGEGWGEKAVVPVARRSIASPAGAEEATA